MYGRKCVGISTSDSGFTVAVKVIREASSVLEDSDAFIEELLDIRNSEDSMGYGSIIYFPNIEWTNEVSEEDEDL